MDVEFARKQMIEQQVRAWRVLDDRVLGVMTEVRRELFVPPEMRDLAFADTSIPLAHCQSMFAPKIEGRVLQALELDDGDEVLEVGTGSGYLAACLARLAGPVRSVEIFPDLSARARENLRASGVGRVTVETLDAMTLTDTNRYDAIAVTGSLPAYYEGFQRMLKVGGRLFVVVGRAPVMDAQLVRRVSADQWVRESLFETVIMPLINAPEPPRFRF
jgi:protein-L-isoaspartate(D-aspartate) O-methyltransferase